jgi:glycosyltransferase involved in cell wall biosynthesis
MYSALRLTDYARRLGCATVVRVENSTAGLPRRPWYRRLKDIDSERNQLMSRANMVIAKSSMVQEELMTGGVERQRIAPIPQHCDTQFFRPVTIARKSEWRANLGWADRFTFVCVGEVVPRKRQLLLVNAIAKLVKEGLNVQLALVGPMNDVAYGKEINQSADTLGVADRLILAGFNRQVQFSYFASDIFVLPSLNECMPNALVESMACGLPAVVSNFAGAVDCIQSGRNGWVIPVDENDFDFWVDRMRMLATSRDNSGLCDFARSVAAERFDSRKIWPQYLAVLQQAAAEGSRY